MPRSVEQVHGKTFFGPIREEVDQNLRSKQIVDDPVDGLRDPESAGAHRERRWPVVHGEAPRDRDANDPSSTVKFPREAPAPGRIAQQAPPLLLHLLLLHRPPTPRAPP